MQIFWVLEMKKIVAILALGLTLFASVDINNASVKGLTTLKGIGQKKAEAIVSYRKDHCFQNIDELKKVKGIGKKIIEKNRSAIEIGKCRR